MVVGGPPPARVGRCRAKIKSSEITALFVFSKENIIPRQKKKAINLLLFCHINTQINLS
jgi:hypothetical protein